MKQQEFNDLGMNLKVMEVATLEPAEFNPGEHPEQQRQEIGKSLDRFKQFKNVVVWQGKVIAGKGVLQSAKEKGLTQLIVNDRSDLSEEEAKALCLADRALPFLGGMNPDLLREILGEIPDAYEVPGVTPNWLENLLGSSHIEFPEYDETVANDIELCICPTCGHEHSKNKEKNDIE